MCRGLSNSESTTEVIYGLDFNDKAEFIAIPFDWSAKLFKDENILGPNVCINSSDGNFWDNTFSDDTIVADQTSGMYVYNFPWCTKGYRIYLPLISKGNRISVYSQTEDGEILNMECADWSTCRTASIGYERVVRPDGRNNWGIV